MLKNLSNIRLDRIIFSDESAIQRGRGYRGEYVRKRQNKRQGREQVSTANRCVMGGPNGPSVRLLTPSIAKKAVTRLQAS